ncbi:hypothetical protein STEG23_022777 [Scotinomys teguina]
MTSLVTCDQVSLDSRLDGKRSVNLLISNDNDDNDDNYDDEDFLRVCLSQDAVIPLKAFQTDAESSFLKHLTGVRKSYLHGQRCPGGLTEPLGGPAVMAVLKYFFQSSRGDKISKSAKRRVPDVDKKLEGIQLEPAADKNEDADNPYLVVVEY